MLCEMMGHNLVDLEAQSIVLPVVNLNIKYRSSARLNDEMIIENDPCKFNKLSATFEQKIIDKKTSRTFIEATVDVVGNLIIMVNYIRKNASSFSLMLLQKQLSQGE